MKILGIIDEDFVNYKKPSMVIEFPYCSFKCDKECGRPVCQNSALVNEPVIEIDTKKIVERYLQNSITEAIVFQGLEPFDSCEDMYDLIVEIRRRTNDDIVIYTGYDYREIYHYTDKLGHIFQNIIIKYGRYVPDVEPHFDPILGVNLASDNQYAEKIS